jgi:TPR repeat protein
MQNNNYLQDLVLWNNNSDTTNGIRKAAMQGEMDAQYALGLCYAEGRGVTQDLINAYHWLSLAIAQGDRDAFDLRAIIVEQMSDDQFQIAKQKLLQHKTG